MEKKRNEKRNEIKISIASSQNNLMSEKEPYKVEKSKPYEKLKEKNNAAKKRIIIMNEKEDMKSSNSKMNSNENRLLLLKKNSLTNNKYIRNNNINNIYHEEYFDKFDDYFNKKNIFEEKKISTEEMNKNDNLDTLSDKESIGNDMGDKTEEEIEEKAMDDINDIFNLIIGYDIYKRIELNHLQKFFFWSVPEGKTLNTNINKIQKDDISQFDYNLEIIRNNQIYFFAQIKKTFPYINIKLFIKTPNIGEYIKVGKIESNVMKNNFIIYKGDNQSNYEKVLNINYELNFFGFKIRKMVVEKVEGNAIKYTLCNDIPEWDYFYKTYKLNFNGRVKQSCKKNFILKYKNNSNINLGEKEENNERLLQCGKIDNNSFALDFISPLSPFEAFSISISSIIYKFSCE